MALPKVKLEMKGDTSRWGRREFIKHGADRQRRAEDRRQERLEVGCTRHGVSGFCDCDPSLADELADDRMLDKQISRMEDERALATGEKTREQLWAENTFLPALRTTIDFSKIRVPE